MYHATDSAPNEQECNRSYYGTRTLGCAVDEHRYVAERQRLRGDEAWIQRHQKRASELVGAQIGQRAHSDTVGLACRDCGQQNWNENTACNFSGGRKVTSGVHFSSWEESERLDSEAVSDRSAMTLPSSSQSKA